MWDGINQSIYFDDVSIVFLSNGCPHLPRKAIMDASGRATRRLSLGCFAFLPRMRGLERRGLFHHLQILLLLLLLLHVVSRCR